MSRVCEIGVLIVGARSRVASRGIDHRATILGFGLQVFLSGGWFCERFPLGDLDPPAHQLIERHVEELGEGDEFLEVGGGFAGFPFGHGLPAHADPMRHVLLGIAACRAQAQEVFLEAHGCSNR